MRIGVTSICAWTVCVLSVAASAQRAARPSDNAPKGPAAPAPRHDISGSWGGVAVPKLEEFAPMTPWGQAFFDRVKPLWGPRAVPIAKSTDPLVTCDPIGFPRSILYETRGLSFEHLPKRTLLLLQYQRVWREIWTDGRPLPTNVGAPGTDTRDPRYYGYSIGNWADDYTFAIKTTGFDETAWADEYGHPRSQNAVIEERYHRPDHDTLEVTVTIDDPKAYTKPFVAMKQTLHWMPKQELDEQLCIPSEALDYRETFTPPSVEK
jgi:hypothetical protein